MDLKPFPTLETKRLRLRALTEHDIPQIVTYANNPRIAEMTLSIPYPYRQKHAKRWIDVAEKGFSDKNHFIFAICRLTTDAFIGGIGLDINVEANRAELGFWIGEPFWNRGYMTEAVHAALSFGFEELNLDEICATHFRGNLASGKVMQKNGMVKQQSSNEHIEKEGIARKLVKYQITKAAFLG